MSDATNITEIREICREIFDAKDDKKDVLLEENNDGNQARQGTEYSFICQLFSEENYLQTT